MALRTKTRSDTPTESTVEELEAPAVELEAELAAMAGRQRAAERAGDEGEILRCLARSSALPAQIRRARVAAVEARLAIAVADRDGYAREHNRVVEAARAAFTAIEAAQRRYEVLQNERLASDQNIERRWTLVGDLERMRDALREQESDGDG